MEVYVLYKLYIVKYWPENSLHIHTHQIFGLGDFKGVYKHLSNFLTKSFELTLKSFFY